MCPKVAPVSALIGLKQTLPHSFSQMFQRILSRIGASKPAAARAALSCSSRFERLPSGSPRMKRLNWW
jgi:hypothetical protein